MAPGFGWMKVAREFDKGGSNTVWAKSLENDGGTGNSKHGHYLGNIAK